jgi:hypothetical protein
MAPARAGANRSAVSPTPVGKATRSGYSPNHEYVEGILIASALLIVDRPLFAGS